MNFIWMILKLNNEWGHLETVWGKKYWKSLKGLGGGIWGAVRTPKDGCLIFFFKIFPFIIKKIKTYESLSNATWYTEQPYAHYLDSIIVNILPYFVHLSTYLCICIYIYIYIYVYLHISPNYFKTDCRYYDTLPLNISVSIF